MQDVSEGKEGLILMYCFLKVRQLVFHKVYQDICVVVFFSVHAEIQEGHQK